MDQNLTEIALVIDRSGSMQACQLEAQNGVNRFIMEQCALPGSALFTLAQFDEQYEICLSGVNKNSMMDYTYALVPRGMTAMLDAIGKTISSVGERLGKLDESARPGLVVVLIVTDGEENASYKFSRERIKQMIEHQQTAYNWQFVYLGANQDAITTATRMGIAGAVATYNVNKSGATYAVASDNVARMRASSAGGQSISNTFTPEETEKIK